MHQVILLTSNLLIYLLFCVGSVLVGIGLMRLSGFHLALRPTLVIAPMITMVFWTIGLGIGVALRTPISVLALILWPLNGAFIVSNIIPMRIARDWGITYWGTRLVQAWQHSRRRAMTQLIGHIWTLVICLILPVAILLPLFSGGLAESPGTPNPDSWSYVAEGQYLWEHARGDAVNLSPLHLHGLRVSQLRYTSGSLLAFLSPLFSAGETYATRGILVSWSIFVFAGACAFFGMKYLMSSWLLLIYLLITVTSGWISNAVLSSNYDNLISLAYFPAFAGLIPLIDLRLRRWQLLLGALGAGMLYAYPELAPFTFAGTFLILSYRIWQERYAWRTWAIFIGGALIIGILLIIPFLRDMINFLLLQTSSAMVTAGTGTRPGEGVFKGLLSLSYYPSAFWGLGGEQTDVYLGMWWIAAGNLVGIPLTILGVIGLFCLFVDRHVGLVAALLLLLFTSFVFAQARRHQSQPV